MKYRLLLSVATAIMLGNKAFAGNTGPVMPSKVWAGFVSIAAGSIWNKSAAETQTFYLAPEVGNTYAARKSNNAISSGELFIGIQKSLTFLWLGQIGLVTAITSNAKLQGVICGDANPVFINHSYQYKIQNTRIAIKGKLLLDKGYWIIPWLSGSLGASFNRAHDFTNTPLIFEALPHSSFTDHTKTAFAYTLGVGIQKIISAYWQVGVGYEFSDWGGSELNRAPDQILNTGLTLNHFYTNGFSFNLTYIA